MDDRVVLLSAWPSPFGMKVQVALAEKGIRYEYKEENLEDKSPLLIEMNPIHKKIPALIHNGKPICESSIIVEYIDEVWSDRSPLLPSDPYQSAQAKFWVDYIDKKIWGNLRNIWAAKGDVQDLAKKEFLEGLQTVEAELGDKAYFVGENFGFVDVVVVPISSWLYTLETCGNFSVDALCPKFIELKHTI